MLYLTQGVAFMLKSKANWKFYNEQINEIDAPAQLVNHLLKQRGIETEEEQERFLHPNWNDISDPSTMHDMEKAGLRIFQAIENEEKITVCGDYDADGVTSTALLMTALRELGAVCDFYIPNRFKEGYGLQKAAIESLHAQGVSLLITVDNGIANVEEVAFANQLGMDVIVTDHHEMQEELPDAYALIHPKLASQYTCKELAGVGVTFQLVHHLFGEMPTYLLDLVAIGTIADMVPLVGENRIFTYYGLKQLNETTNCGIRALINQCKITDKVTERNVGFSLAPRLNAVGRLQDASLAVDLLLTEDEEEAKQIAHYIDELNKERQQIVTEIVKEAEKQVNHEDGILVLYDENWHEGVLGIAASRLVNRFDRPVMMLHYNKEAGTLKGSARSIPAFHLFENCMDINDLFTKFGGHSQAAGMTFPFANLEEIKAQLNEKVFAQVAEEDFKKEIQVSASLSPNQITEELVQQIAMFAPFGMQNEEPVFHLKAIPNQVRQIGQENKHLKMQFMDQDKQMDALGFFMGEMYYLISEQIPVSVIGKLQINEWNGNRTVQMIIEDMEIKEWQLFDYRGKQHEKYVRPYLNHYNHHIILANHHKIETEHDTHHVQQITYETDVSELTKSDILYIYDLPYDLTKLREIVKQIEPSSIHVSYGVTEDAFLQAVPSREDFKWVYGFLLKHQPIHLKLDLPKIIRMKRWTKERIIFILKVFFDLEFIRVEKDVITVNTDAEKKQLHESNTYRLRMQQSDIEKTLYYSTYDELKQWFGENLTVQQKKEELCYES